ncbi:MAG: 7-cyano-7-deazaguanine synthase QueC [Candidatus Omnitrophica bacterium]|nr:7-cyano-7-deazaguanine synthase QueC [Candidatus Omnitrophota bacterium]
MKNKGAKRAVVLLSGGLDSATVLYLARAKGYTCSCLIFDYGQLHKKEVLRARRIAEEAGCAYKILKISLPWKGSALLDRKIKIPEKIGRAIPATYVPSRNIIFLSFAASFAEAIGAHAIFIGAHAQDYSGYPDCRPEFITAFGRAIKTGTCAGPNILAPLLGKNKSQIILMGHKLGVPFELTWSCYRGAKTPCLKCDSCRYRAKGFKEAGIVDPLIS